jgi:hypothetical protein
MPFIIKLKEKINGPSNAKYIVNLSFKNWLEQAPSPSASPTMSATTETPAVKNIKRKALQSAVAASRTGKDPVQAVKDSVLQQAQSGNVDLKDLGKLLPK